MYLKEKILCLGYLSFISGRCYWVKYVTRWEEEVRKWNTNKLLEISIGIFSLEAVCWTRGTLYIRATLPVYMPFIGGSGLYLLLIWIRRKLIWNRSKVGACSGVASCRLASDVMKALSIKFQLLCGVSSCVCTVSSTAKRSGPARSELAQLQKCSLWVCWHLVLSVG